MSLNAWGTEYLITQGVNFIHQNLVQLDVKEAQLSISIMPSKCQWPLLYHMKMADFEYFCVLTIFL